MKDYEKTIAQTLTDAQTTLEGLSNAEAQRARRSTAGTA